MTSVLEVFSRQWRASSARRDAFFAIAGLSAAGVAAAGAAGLAASFAAGLSWAHVEDIARARVRTRNRMGCLSPGLCAYPRAFPPKSQIGTTSRRGGRG